MRELPPLNSVSSAMYGFSICGFAAEAEGSLVPLKSEWPAEYNHFFEKILSGSASIRFSEESADDIPVDSEFVPHYEASSWALGSIGKRTIYRFHAGYNTAYLWAEPDLDYSCIRIWRGDLSVRSLPPLMHPVDRVLWMGILANRSAFIVHACGWLHKNQTLLFPGVSGAGKTTLCRQLMTLEEGRVLSDDRVVLRQFDGCFHAFGTPWPGDARQACNAHAPLSALCFIEKSKDAYLIQIGAAETLRRLLESVSIPWYNTCLRELVLTQVEKLVAFVPAYRLGFCPDPGVLDKVLPLVRTTHEV